MKIAQSIRLLKTGLTFVLLTQSLLSYAIKPVSINKETPEYIIDIKYPQGFKSATIDAGVKKFIEEIQSGFMGELAQDADTPADAPGKTGINVTYSIPYNSGNALSIRYNVSIYHRGAAHPSNNVKVQNFIKDKPVSLSDLFTAGVPYLKTIADFSSKEIARRKISDEQWIKNGASPTEDNYKLWTFTNKGIDILFDSYQVAAYVYGEQTVAIPLSVLSPMLQPEVKKAVWGN